jgi:hypothetical protein
MARRLAAAAVAALALSGCGAYNGFAPLHADRPTVALAFGEDVAELDAQLAGVVRAPDDAQTRKAATDLWRETVRTARELPKQLDAVGPVGGPLDTAAEEARLAAAALHGPRPAEAHAEAEGHLRRSAEALAAAADALDPQLPRSSAPDLERLRAALPPPA